MSEASRIRRLYVENRLAELAWKHGPPETSDVPAWLDHYPETPDEWAEWRRAQGVPPREPEPAPEPPLPSAPAWTWDEYGESPILACPRCGEHSAKANIRIDLWNCTACQACGKAHAWPGRPGPTRRRLPTW